MAQKTQVIMVDDLNGEDFTQGETISFGLDGASYEIDLNADHVRDLREVLKPYVEAARKAPAADRRPSRRGGRASAVQPGTKAIRAWAESQPDIQVNARGRIPGWVIDRYEAAQKAPKVQASPAPEAPAEAAEKPSKAPRRPRGKKVQPEPEKAPEAAFSG